MSNDSILNKIKKCLALAKSANANEAAIALKQAKILMQKHQLTMTDVKMADVSLSQAPARGNRTPANYESLLVNVIAKAFNCQVIYSLSEDYKYVWKFVGVSPDDEVAAYTALVLQRQLQKAREDYIVTQLKRCKKSTKTKRADTFCRAWVSSIANKVMAFAEVDKEKSQLINTYMNKKFGSLDTAKSRTNNNKHDFRDVLSGIESAHGAHLNRGMDTEKNQLLET